MQCETLTPNGSREHDGQIPDPAKLHETMKLGDFRSSVSYVGCLLRVELHRASNRVDSSNRGSRG